MNVTLHLGLPNSHRKTAALLYWEAFGGKLGRVMGPEAKALAYLERVIQADHVIIALEGEAMIGMAGFKTPNGAFADGGWKDMRQIYGTIGAIWRLGLLALLNREVDNHRFLVDGICVSHNHRGHGVGAALVQALCAEAAARGYSVVRLEVIDTNLRARKLYERLGFTVLRRDELGILRHAFGFASATTMIRELDQTDGAD
ncbi:GNAT family N-acetyltransferase [Gemmobacter fulvus]|uniref:GNAT family N-acetyltransferase n=1 Tax=Gemmobacter fulvus TaxID=2840474 RepID=A0A975P9C5_9RHOB|nr:GNAT family N-acetyltransferase [Gemmobacter fulvus]MBT9244694.1 GNAT family N-acetyltransferase [Gemmobacter fulvus]QWK91548.1 GNAT family N-acetyltransferase [Gemmobacter fulvus]